MRTFLLISFLSLSAAAFAGDPKFPVSDIPEALKKNADVVVRDYEKVFSILSTKKAGVECREVYTIFNNNGKDYATKVLAYSKLIKILNFTAVVYDLTGKQIKKLKSSEIFDQSAYDGYSLFSDLRIKVADLTSGVYPYTVEFTYEMEFKYLYSIYQADYELLPDEKVSVERSSFTLKYPVGYKARFKSHNISVEPKRETIDNVESLQWSFNNVSPIILEAHGPAKEELFPYISVAPSSFEYEGYVGNMDSWEEYGKWNASLNQGRDILPEETKQKVRAITQNLPTKEAKIKALYEFMQSKTRYVSISLGIGGLQPFDAKMVDETGYGDCKALSNYMVALLKEAGIKGYYTTVRAGEGETQVELDFPSHQSNHVIVAVPNETDTLWLECTSQTNPFGYMGTFTGERKAMLITEGGGVMVNTPRYPAYQNVQSRHANVSIHSTGDAEAKVVTEYCGLRYEDDGLYAILNNQYDQQRKWVTRTTDIPSFDVKSFKFENHKAKIPSASVTLDLSLRKLASVSGKRLMLTPNLMNRNKFIPEKLETRRTEIVEDVGFIDYDTIVYRIPDEIYPEVLPQPSKFSSRFGEYEANYKIDQGLVVYTRKLKINKGRFPASTYNEFVDFYKSISRADNTKLVFLNKT